MATYQTPSTPTARRIEADAHADARMCWTCGACDGECPVGIATGGLLRPQKMVRLANLGFTDELADLPEIWYCLRCNRCRDVCPNLVRPIHVIEYARREALSHQTRPQAFIFAHEQLRRHFQRVRWQTVQHCRNEDAGTISDDDWRGWCCQPVEDAQEPVRFTAGAPIPTAGGNGHSVPSANPCFTCGECSSACPASAERDVFDARSIFRMAVLGQRDALKRSASLWLCLQCGRCTEACTQGVDGRQVILDLREEALAEGIVDDGFLYRLKMAERTIYRQWTRAVDRLAETVQQYASDRKVTKWPTDDMPALDTAHLPAAIDPVAGAVCQL